MSLYTSSVNPELKTDSPNRRGSVLSAFEAYGVISLLQDNVIRNKANRLLMAALGSTPADNQTFVRGLADLQKAMWEDINAAPMSDEDAMSLLGAINGISNAVYTSELAADSAG